MLVPIEGTPLAEVEKLDAIQQQLTVEHANGVDIIKAGQYLNANYGILITS